MRTCPNCKKELTYDDLCPIMDAMADNQKLHWRFQENCKYCSKPITFEKDGNYYYIIETKRYLIGAK